MDNLSNLVGSVSAGQLIRLAGGKDKLSAMPACNIQVLGIQRKALVGYSAILVVFMLVIKPCSYSTKRT
jgi:U4/U6 small nuclear ribonucleoprotein PRP31